MATTVDSISSTYKVGETAAKREVAGGELGKNEFLEILAYQLANQDPLEPMKDTDFIAQMAQFSALEQMQALNETFAASQAYSLVGKDIEATIKVNGADYPVYGNVEGVVNYNGSQYLLVGDFLVPPANVTGVYDPLTGTQAGSNITLTEASSLVGKEITATIQGASAEEETREVSGKVDSVFIKNGELYANVNGVEVPITSITQIGEANAEAAEDEVDGSDGEVSTEGVGEADESTGTDEVTDGSDDEQIPVTGPEEIG